MNGSLIHDLIRRETNRLRAMGKGYEASARQAVAIVEAIHLKQLDALREAQDMGRELRKRTA